jgi:hypothetical protein
VSAACHARDLAEAKPELVVQLDNQGDGKKGH